MSESGGEKTEAPTPKRKRKAADEGQILSSKDFGTALIVLLGCAWMAMLGPALIRACKRNDGRQLQLRPGRYRGFRALAPDRRGGWKLALPIGGLLLVAVAGAVLSHAGLAGLRWNSKLFAPKASRINPGSGLKRIFGPTGWIEMGKALLKVVLLGRDRPLAALVAHPPLARAGRGRSARRDRRDGRRVPDAAVRDGGRADADRGHRPADPDPPAS